MCSSDLRQWRALPPELPPRCAALLAASDARVKPQEALALARDLSEALEVEEQLWLLDWWQLRLWRQRPDASQQRRLETLRRQLRAYVQPRLAWEVALLDLSGAV